MRGEILFNILNSLKDKVLVQIDFTNAILSAGYGASGGKINYEFSKLQNKRVQSELHKKKLVNFRKYISKLKRDGLVVENSSRKIHLSQKGKTKLRGLQNSPYLNKSLYQKKIGNTVVVVSYDLPVAFNSERNRLRDMLRMLGFQLIHKSVWVGKVVLPTRFIADLGRLRILDYVEILEVTKKGTLKSKN